MDDQNIENLRALQNLVTVNLVKTWRVSPTDFIRSRQPANSGGYSLQRRRLLWKTLNMSWRQSSIKVVDILFPLCSLGDFCNEFYHNLINTRKEKQRDRYCWRERLVTNLDYRWTVFVFHVVAFCHGWLEIVYYFSYSMAERKHTVGKIESYFNK